jgi:hypothetical protein
MQSIEILTIFSLFYKRSGEAEWKSVVEKIGWQNFLAAAHTPSRSNDRPEKPTALSTAHRGTEAMPSYREFIDFANKHYVGGLPISIVAVESLYRNWSFSQNIPLLFARESGLYDSDHAQHMRYLYQAYGVQPADVSLPPDHLSNLLPFLGLLTRYASRQEVEVFIDEHLSWIADLSDTIARRAPEALWLAAITTHLINYLSCLKNASVLA